MRKSDLQKDLKQFIDENCPLAWRLKGDKVMFATFFANGKARDFNKDMGTVEDWQFDFEYTQRKGA